MLQISPYVMEIATFFLFDMLKIQRHVLSPLVASHFHSSKDTLWVEQREEMDEGLNAFVALTQKYVDVEELTQTIVNEYIKKIVVFAPDKSSSKRQQKVKIYFNFVDDVEIPVISETITTETTYGRRKTA